MDKLRLFLRQLFCKDDCEWCRKIEMFQCLSGERHYFVCKKCGKVTDERFVTW